MRKVLVIGMGKSGRAAKTFLERKGESVVCVDSDPEIVKELGLSQTVSVADFDLVVVSPGVPPTDPFYAEAIQKKCSIIGEAELALQTAKQPCIAVTGSNGKTTVTLLIEHVLKTAGKKAKALGNVGVPLCEYFLHPDPDEIVVAELSSFQLETMSLKIFDAGVILNITPNHLDRHGSMEEYAKAKCRLQDCIKEGGDFYLHPAIVREFGKLLKGNYQTLEGVESFFPILYRQWGRHEAENGLAAWALCRSLGVRQETFVQALETFKKPAHRIEFVRELEGVVYIDDSKGTNVDATLAAVKSVRSPVILIAGGLDKGTSYAPWKEVFKGRVKKVVVLGQAAEKIERELESLFPMEKAASLEQAVQAAQAGAEAGDTVLLSPGCASYDMFHDFAHRGDEFKRFVHQLVERRKKE